MEHLMKVLGILLVVVALGVAVPATLSWWSDRSDAAEHEAFVQELEQTHKKTLKTLQETNLLYRGYQKSVPQIPDSIRAAESAIISGHYKEYNKKITALEMTETNQARQIQRARTKRAERAEEARRSILPLAAGALVLLLAGVVVLRRS